MCITSNLFAAVLYVAELCKTLESCTEPRHPARISVKTMFSTQTTCTFTEWNFFQLMYASGSSIGALMLICVPSIRPTTPGNLNSSNEALTAHILCSEKSRKHTEVYHFIYNVNNSKNKYIKTTKVDEITPEVNIMKKEALTIWPLYVLGTKISQCLSSPLQHSVYTAHCDIKSVSYESGRFLICLWP